MKIRKGFCLALSLVLAAVLVLPVGAAGTGSFAEAVNGLPRLETVKSLSKLEQQALYETIDAIWEDSFYSKSDAEQKQLEQTPQFVVLKSLTEYLNEAQISPLQWLDCGQLQISGEDLTDGEDYAYDPTAKELIITGKKPVTVTVATEGGVSTDTIRTTGEAELTLKDVSIQAEEGKSALTAENGLKLTLVGENTLTAQDHAAISGAEGITLSGIGSLTVQGGVGADGIGAKSLTVTGGTLIARGGDGTPGTEEAKGGNGGSAVGTDALTVTGGSLNLTGGKGGTDGGSGAGEDGRQSACTPSRDQKPLAQTQVKLTDAQGNAVAGRTLASLALSPDESYGLGGVVTDDSGAVYLYLPEDTKATAVSDGTDTYTGTPIASGESGVLTLTADTPVPPTEAPTTTAPTEAPPTAPTEAPTEKPTEAPTTPPAKKASQAAPALELESKTGSTVTLKAPTGIGTVYYAYGTNADKPETNWVETRTFIDLKPGKTYYFFAYFGGDDNTEASPVSQALAVALSGDFSNGDIVVQGATKTYDGKSVSVSASIPAAATIRFRENDTGDYSLDTLPSYTNAGTYKIGYQVTMEGYNTVTGTVTIQINRATPTVTISDLTVKHDGNTHPMSGAKVTGVNGESYRGSVSYTYYTDGQLTQGKTSIPPSAVGTYYVQAYVPAGGNYTEATSNTAKLVIEQSSTTTTKPTTGNNTNQTTTGKTYTVTATAGTGGTISQSGKVSVQSGKSASFTIVADKNYEVEDVKVDGKSMGSVGVYTFTDVKADHTIEATFRRTVAETTAPTTEATTAPTETTPDVSTETVPATTEEVTKPVKKKGIPIIVPILLVLLAGGAIGGAVYVYRKYGEEE